MALSAAEQEELVGWGEENKREAGVCQRSRWFQYVLTVHISPTQPTDRSRATREFSREGEQGRYKSACAG